MSWNISAATRPADDAGNDLLVINLLIYELAFGCYSIANRAVNIGDWGDFCLRAWFSFLMINSEQVIETFEDWIKDNWKGDSNGSLWWEMDAEWMPIEDVAKQPPFPYVMNEEMVWCVANDFFCGREKARKDHWAGTKAARGLSGRQINLGPVRLALNAFPLIQSCGLRHHDWVAPTNNDDWCATCSFQSITHPAKLSLD